jgi:hypothetical protein
MQIETQTLQVEREGPKKPYARPTLVTHGKVEAVTTVIPGPGTSQPINP